MAAGTQAVWRASPRASFANAETIDWLARLLLVAVALDLVVTRFVVRLAIFIPKGEALATLSAALGRIGAAADAFVPLAGLLLLGALLVRAGRPGRRGEAAILVALAVVAAGGFALIHLPPRPAVVLVLDSLVVAVAVGSAIRAREAMGPVVARIGFVALAAAIGLAAIGRAVDLVGVLAGSNGALTLAFVSVGQLAFVCGAALVGLGGVVGLRRRDQARGRFAALGLASALVVLVAAAQAPATWGALAIWSIGLAGAVPAPVVAVALGLAVAGLPVLHGRAPALAIGTALVLLSGYDLAASGLVLAGLLGLVVARLAEPTDPHPSAMVPARRHATVPGVRNPLDGRLLALYNATRYSEPRQSGDASWSPGSRGSSQSPSACSAAGSCSTSRGAMANLCGASARRSSGSSSAP